MIFYKVSLTLLTLICLTLVWHTSFAVETFKQVEKQFVVERVLELSLSGNFSANLSSVDTNHALCTDKEILLYSNNEHYQLKLSFQNANLTAPNWHYFSLSLAQPLKLEILINQEVTNFQSLEGNLDFYKDKGYLYAYLQNQQGKSVFLSGYFKCSY